MFHRIVMAMSTRRKTPEKNGVKKKTLSSLLYLEVKLIWKGSYFLRSENKNAKREYKVFLFFKKHIKCLN